MSMERPSQTTWDKIAGLYLHVPPLGLLDVLAILPNQLRASNHVKLNLNKERRLLEHLWRLL